MIRAAEPPQKPTRAHRPQMCPNTPDSGGPTGVSEPELCSPVLWGQESREGPPDCRGVPEDGGRRGRVPRAHGARTEGSAFLGHLLSALGQLVVGASAGGKTEPIWNMEKQLVGIKLTLAHGIQKPRRIPAMAFFLVSVKISPFLAISATAIPQPLQISEHSYSSK